MNLKPAVFLDRDGTLIEERGHIGRVQDVEILPGAFEAVRRIHRAGLPAVVVTNQSGVARGLFGESQVKEIHQFLIRTFRQEGAPLEHFYYCPHHPEAAVEAYRAACACRKPAPGLLLAAAQDLNLDLTRSVVVGDTLRDIEAGRRVGSRGVLVRTGHGAREEESLLTAGEPEVVPDFVADDVLEGVRWILEKGFE